MKRRLLYFVYVDGTSPYDEGFHGSMAEYNFINLKRYADRFDSATFILSTAPSIDNIDRVLADYTSYIMSIGFDMDVEFITEPNTQLREADAFHRHFVMDMDRYDGDLVFFGHTKGTTNNANESLMKWICAMYYFSLEDIDMVTDWMVSKRKAFYGFPLIDASDSSYHPFEVRPKHKYYYYGTMYWTNPGLLKAYMADDWHKGEIPELFDRYYAEWFPAQCLPMRFAGTFGDVSTLNGIDLYNNFDILLGDFEAGLKGDSPVPAFMEHYKSIMDEFNSQA